MAASFTYIGWVILLLQRMKAKKLSFEFGLGVMFYTVIWVAEFALGWFYLFTGLPGSNSSAVTDIPNGEFDAKCYICLIIFTNLRRKLSPSLSLLYSHSATSCCRGF